MIKQIELTNFQSWKKGSFDLDPGVNVFLGASDKGKSAVFRAAEWVRTNRPLGIDFVSDFADKKDRTEATLVLDNGVIVTRGRDAKGNYYKASTLKEELRAFKGEVPESVSNLLNMSDINVQGQHDSPFLLSESPPEIGRKLNQVASLADIDMAFKNISGMVRSFNANIKNTEEALEYEHVILQEFIWLADAEYELAAMEKRYVLVNQVRHDEMELRNAKTKIITTHKQIEKYTTLLGAEEPLSKIQEKASRAEELNRRYDYLEPLEERLEKADKIIQKNSEIIEAKTIVSGFMDKINSFNKVMKTLSQFQLIQERLDNAQDTRAEALKLHQTRLDEFTREKPNICPLCNQAWASNLHEH